MGLSCGGIQEFCSRNSLPCFPTNPTHPQPPQHSFLFQAERSFSLGNPWLGSCRKDTEPGASSWKIPGILGSSWGAQGTEELHWWQFPCSWGRSHPHPRAREFPRTFLEHLEMWDLSSRVPSTSPGNLEMWGLSSGIPRMFLGHLEMWGLSSAALPRRGWEFPGIHFPD